MKRLEVSRKDSADWKSKSEQVTESRGKTGNDNVKPLYKRVARFSTWDKSFPTDLSLKISANAAQ